MKHLLNDPAKSDLRIDLDWIDLMQEAGGLSAKVMKKDYVLGNEGGQNLKAIIG